MIIIPFSTFTPPQSMFYTDFHNCKGASRFPLYHHIYSYSFLSLGDHFQPCAIISLLARSFPLAIIHRIPSRAAARHRTASPGLVTAARGFVVYMDTSLYSFTLTKAP